MIIEDDYDAEYRYDREPVGALQGLAPEHVVYGASASKTLAPALRLGWLVLPERLGDRVAFEKLLADGGSPTLEQLALADLVTRGEHYRHLDACASSTAAGATPSSPRWPSTCRGRASAAWPPTG